jgi:hypothetical protein
MVGMGVAAGSILPAKRWVEGRAGGLVPWGMGSRSAGTSTRPLLTKTLAWGLATMTRAGGAPRRAEAVFNSAVGVGAGLTAAGSGGGSCCGGVETEGTGCEGDF